MDIKKEELTQINSLLEKWSTNTNHEIEATFGDKGKVDSTTFLAIAQRLKAKGFESNYQHDKLCIITPYPSSDPRNSSKQNVRFTIDNIDNLQSYCEDDRIEDKDFTAMIKSRTGPEANVELPEYDVRIKSRNEEELGKDDPGIDKLLQRWQYINKAFRLIRRWTFETKGMRIDMSIVRSSPIDPKTKNYIYTKTFLEQNIFNQEQTYEVEVELLHDEITNTPQKALGVLIKGIGEVLRGIQNNFLLISASEKNRVFTEYRLLNNNNISFRGVSPVTLMKKNMTEAIVERVDNIRSGYNVTDKADGLRALGFCDSKGELFLIDMNMNIYRTGLRNSDCKNTLVDGEWIRKDRERKAVNSFYLFDIYKVSDEVYPVPKDKADVSQLIFYDPTKREEACRYNALTAWSKKWSEKDNGKDKEKGPTILKSAEKYITPESKLKVSVKNFKPVSKENGNLIFTAAKQMLIETEEKEDYITDGLIFTPNYEPLPLNPGTFYKQFKWKPAKDNTIDFYVTIEKDEENNDKIVSKSIGDGPTGNYKVLRLYVGADSKSESDNTPRNIILNEIPIIEDKDPRADKLLSYKPVLFYPKNNTDVDSMPNTSYIEVVQDEALNDIIRTEDSEEPIQNGSIIEMKYVIENEIGHRWVPIRIRHDKTERFHKAQKEIAAAIASKHKDVKVGISRTLNNIRNANSIWETIHDPITREMIETGKESVKSVESDKYFAEGAKKSDEISLVRKLRDFHNKVIKNKYLYGTIKKQFTNSSIIDYACGKAADVGRYRYEAGAKVVYGIDYSADNINNTDDGAYARYLKQLKEYGKEITPRMLFSIGDSSQRIITGDAGINDDEKNIIRQFFGRVSPDRPVPYVYVNKLSESLKDSTIIKDGFDAGVCMSAIHYFFKSKETLNGFMQNLKDTIKEGGLFMGMCFDGNKVFQLLKDADDGAEYGKVDDTLVWSIKKEYGSEFAILPSDESSLGLEIKVKFITISIEHSEYLVSYPYLVKVMRENGFEILSGDDLKKYGLKSSTDTFDNTFKETKGLELSPVEKEFSFLNRWFIFKRISKSEEKGLADARTSYTREQRRKIIDDIVKTTFKPETKINDLVTKLGMSKSSAKAILGSKDKESAISRTLDRLEKGLEMAEDEEEAAADGEGEVAEAAEPAEVAAAAPSGPAPTFILPAKNATIDVKNIFILGMSVKQTDILKIGDANAGRWISPTTLYDIPDMDEPAIKYPTIIHFMAAMKIKHAGKRPELAKDLFSIEGSIHSKNNTKREHSDRTEISMSSILSSEMKDVVKSISPESLLSYRIAIDEERDWYPIRDTYLRYALEYRFMNDERFRKVVEAARIQKKYLLYLDFNNDLYLGGDYKAKKIRGDNKVGIFIMEIAGFKIE